MSHFIQVGALVRTVEGPRPPHDWSSEVVSSRRFGAIGTVIDVEHSGHGTYAWVRHRDTGTRAPYHLHELYLIHGGVELTSGDESLGSDAECGRKESRARLRQERDLHRQQSAQAKAESRPRPLVGVAVLVLTADESGGGSWPTADVLVLTGMRSGSHGAGTVSVPGGHLEHGESPAECAARELEEETGIVVPSDRFVFVGFTNDIIPSDYSPKHYVTLFMATVVHDSVTPASQDPKFLEVRWRHFEILEEVVRDHEGHSLFQPLATFIQGGGVGRTVTTLWDQKPYRE